MRVGICVAGLCRAKEASISAASGTLKDMAERTGLELVHLSFVKSRQARNCWAERPFGAS